MNAYYDGTKLLSLLTLSGKKPEIYICNTNRSSGKTTFFNRMCVKKFINNKSKFGILYRYNNELNGVSEKFFKEINQLFFKNHKMTEKERANGTFIELFLDDVSCGYAFSLNSDTKLKKYSHLLSDCDRYIFDEFQDENNRYLKNEVNKFISVHTSVARGNGKQIRYVPVYMISNPISLLNPYYIDMNISTKLTHNTHFLRGEGYVLEQSFNMNSAKLHKNSQFNTAFSNNDYIPYLSENIYLNDDDSFIEKINEKSKYLFTLKYNKKFYSIKQLNSSIIYCCNKTDSSFPKKYAVQLSDISSDYPLLNNVIIIKTLRDYFEKGYFRFSNIDSKQAIMKLLSY